MFVSPYTHVVVTMAKIQFLTILLAATCFLGGVISVTDKEFEVCNVQTQAANKVAVLNCIFFSLNYIFRIL